MRVNPTGSVEVFTGCHSTAKAMRPPSRSLSRTGLGLPIDQVNVLHGDTETVQFGMGTYGSRSGAVGMSAIVKALDKVEAKGQKNCRASA